MGLLNLRTYSENALAKQCVSSIVNNFIYSDVALICFVYRGRIQRKTWCMGPYAEVDYIISPYVYFRVDSITFTMGNAKARVDLNPMPYVDFAFGLILTLL